MANTSVMQLKEKMLRLNAARLAAGARLFGKPCHVDDSDDFFCALNNPTYKRTNQEVFLIKLMLRQVEALQSVPSHSMDYICRHIRRKRVPKSELVVKKGDSATECYIVASGQIDVEVRIPDKKHPGRMTTIVVFHFKPGDFFGDYGLQEASATRTADCRAKSDCEVLSIPKSVYCKYMLQHMYGNRDLKKEFFIKRLLSPLYPPKFLEIVTNDNHEKFAEYDKKLTEQMNWMVCKSFTKGSVIGLQGHPSRAVFFVVQGIVRCLKTIFVNGKPVILEIGKYQKGQSFGAQFTQIEEKNVHSWVAEGPVTLYTIGKSDFQKLFRTVCVGLYKNGTNQLQVSQGYLRKTLKQQADWAHYKKKLIQEKNEGCDLTSAIHQTNLPKHIAKQEFSRIERETYYRMGRWK